jgi:hypothetical protein
MKFIKISSIRIVVNTAMPSKVYVYVIWRFSMLVLFGLQQVYLKVQIPNSITLSDIIYLRC